MSEEYLYIESKIKSSFLKGNNILLFTEKDEKKNIFSKMKSMYLNMQYNDKPIHEFFILNENLQELLDALYQEENTSNVKELSEKLILIKKVCLIVQIAFANVNQIQLKMK